MTRKSTSELRRHLAAQESADDALASKLHALTGWIAMAERSRVERDDAVKAAIDEDRAAFMGELRTMAAEIAAVISELRGAPVQIDEERPKSRSIWKQQAAE